MPPSSGVFPSLSSPADIVLSDPRDVEDRLITSNSGLRGGEPKDVNTARSRRWLRWNRSRNLANKWWLWEVLNCFVSFACLGSICAILAVYGDFPISKWLLPWSINSIIALFSTVMRSSMMEPVAAGISQMKWLWFKKERPLRDVATYDAASRGPLGSLFFLGNVKWR